MPSLEELLTDKPELLTQVNAVIGDKKLHVTNDGSWIPKDKFNELNEEKKQLSAQLTERDGQLETLKKNSGDAEKLKADLQRMQEENKAAKDKYEAEMIEVKRSSAVKTALLGKVHNPDLAIRLLDMSKVELDENGAIKAGFEDQVKALETSDAYLFVPKAPGAAPFVPIGAAPGSSNVPPVPAGGAQGYGKQAAQAKKAQTTGAVESPYFTN